MRELSKETGENGERDWGEREALRACEAQRASRENITPCKTDFKKNKTYCLQSVLRLYV